MSRQEVQKQILKELATIWEEYPEQRFGQLLINLCLVPDDMELWNRYDEDSLKIVRKRTNFMRVKR